MKKVSIAMIILALTVSLSACGNRQYPSQTTPSTAPTATASPSTTPAIDPTMGTNIPDPDVNTSMPDMTGSSESTSGYTEETRQNSNPQEGTSHARMR